MQANFVNLSKYIDFSSAECLNESAHHPLPNPTKSPPPYVVDPRRNASEVYLESDVDEQLLIFFPFEVPVNLGAIGFTSPPDGSGPKCIKLFTNRHLSFAEAESTVPTQELEVSADDLQNVRKHTLKYVKFQNISSVTIFAVNNQEGRPCTKIGPITLWGVPRAKKK